MKNTFANSILLTLLFISVMMMGNLDANAQPGSLDFSFNPGTGVAGGGLIGVMASALQSDGKIILGGLFYSYNGTARNNIVRVNTDGSLDGSFNPGTGTAGRIEPFHYGYGDPGQISTIAIQSDGKILIGGFFTFYNGTGRTCVARLNSDGSLDGSFVLSGTGLNGAVYSISIQSDGKIIIGGWFTTYNGTSRRCIARLNTDGSLDSSFNPGTGLGSASGVDQFLFTTAIQSNGKIIIGGWFTSFNGTSRRNIARLNSDGSLDVTFDSGSGPIGGDWGGSSGNTGTVWSTAIQNDNKILIGGSFTTYNGASINALARLNSDGSRDVSFLNSTGFNSNCLGTYVFAIGIQSDGEIIIGGRFNDYNGTGRNHIACLNTDGTLNTAFNPGSGTAGGLVCSDIWTLLIQPDDRIVIGGDFTSYNSTNRNLVARITGRQSCTLPTDCNDNNACTTDACNSGTCANTPLDCNDNNACTTDACNSGTCTHTPLNCDDGNPNTADVCVNGQCQHNCVSAADCNDNNACTTDACNSGICSNTPLNCNDNNACTTDACSTGTCVHTPLSCNDNNACTTDACNSGICSNTPLNCDDADPGTIDVCVNGQCQHNPAGAAIPTLSEWGLILFMLLLIGYGTGAIMRYQPAIAGEKMKYMHLPYFFGSLPFSGELYRKVLLVLMPLVAAGFALIHFFIGTNGALDFTGTIASTVIVAYIVHLVMGVKR